VRKQRWHSRTQCSPCISSSHSQLIRYHQCVTTTGLGRHIRLSPPYLSGWFGVPSPVMLPHVGRHIVIS
jgi:hypothetical protein